MYINNLPSPCYVSNSDILKGFIDLICEHNEQKIHVQVVFNFWRLIIHLTLLAILTILGIACKIHFFKCYKQQQKIGHVWIALKVLIVFNIVLWLSIIILFVLTFFWSDTTIIIVYTYFNVIVVVVNVMTATFILHQVNRVMTVNHMKEQSAINIKKTRTEKICKEIVNILFAISIGSLPMLVMVHEFNEFEEYQNNDVNMTLCGVNLMLHLLCIFGFGLGFYQCILFLRNIVANKFVEPSQTGNLKSEIGNLKAYQILEVEEAKSTEKKSSLNNKATRVGLIGLITLHIWQFCFFCSLGSHPYSRSDTRGFIMIESTVALISVLIPEFYLLLTYSNED